MYPESVYLWYGRIHSQGHQMLKTIRILPMFHACGWTYPWAITAAFATQITLRTVNVSQIWYHLLKSGVTHYCAAPTVQVSLLVPPGIHK